MAMASARRPRDQAGDHKEAAGGGPDPSCCGRGYRTSNGYQSLDWGEEEPCPECNGRGMVETLAGLTVCPAECDDGVLTPSQRA